MVDVIYASGSFQFRDGVLATQYVGYVLGAPGDQGWDFQGGSAAVYGLHDHAFFARGYAALGNGSASLFSEPLGAFEDFAMYPEAQPDPLNGFVLADNSGTLTGLGATWSRHYRVVVPPKGARFAVPHIRFGSVPAGVSQYLDAHQFEVVPVGQFLPSPFSHARTVKVSVRPSRTNYYSGSPRVSDLVPGRTYIASALVSGKRTSYLFTAGADGSIDLPFGDSVIDNGNGTSTDLSATDNGDGTSAVPSGLDNGDGTSTVGVQATQIMVEEGAVLRDYFDGNSGPDYLWEDDSLVITDLGDGTETVTSLNSGASVVDNGNGTMAIASGVDNGDGTMTIVSTGGTSGRSYYYPDRQMRHYVLMRNLRQNVALGMTVDEPVYATLPAASSTA